MTPERFQRLTQVLNRRQADLTVIADEVHKGRNLAAIVRTCDAVGIDRLHSIQPKAGYKPFRGTALGSQKWVDICQYEALQEPVALLKEQGFKIVAADVGERTIDYRDYDYTQKTALLLGTEKAGLSDFARGQVDQAVTVPMMGMVESFNVSVACAIILAQAQRQRQLAGCYDVPGLDDATYKRRLFQWCQPRVRGFCDERGLEYPELDEEGEIVDGPRWYEEVRLNRK